ncbi:DUF1667 domain-containing protein [Zongyangia hominis]|uniref:DUF1667 domain-containing protein n=1 Tax=Zongyangia hominis TaxID=2763677 RepID=A0A926EAV0_9FIRM|nr:DUF1667 domain-containing protein [Zongyangia hominis]MBC8569620.1 DUF1667 domain-containing protein [Zongyangia hominis]
MKELICIVCPKGCHLRVDEENGYAVTGHSCPKGQDYGYKELTNPTRVITSTVKIDGGIHRRLPVKTNRDIPKGKIFDVVKALDAVEVSSPIQVGDVIVKNILDTGADIVATRDM